MSETNSKSKQKPLEAVVIKDACQKSRVVIVESLKKHPVFGKYIKTRTKMMVHDENNSAKKGDRVIIQECKPVSKRKRWAIVKIQTKGE